MTMLTGLLLSALLLLLIAAVCWLALETRRVWQALAVYSAAVQSWHTMIAELKHSQEERR